jgi:CRISPR-associated protein Csm4
MKTYALTITAASPHLTPFQADTVFGHLCWAVAHRDGDEGIKRFLEPFLAGAPPFVLSDGFPEGWVAKPALFEQMLMDPSVKKKAKKSVYITVKDFKSFQNGKAELHPSDPSWSRTLSKHNRIDRETGRTPEKGQGGLYTLEETFIPRVVIYIKANDEATKGQVAELFEILSLTGFGKKKAIGKGQFTVESVKECDEFAGPADADGFVTLSGFCPAAGDPVDGAYRTFVKFGKLGEEFTYCGNPFKRPLLMVTSGSVFKTNGQPKEYYGRMVKDVSKAKPEAVQYAYAFAVPVKYPFI